MVEGYLAHGRKPSDEMLLEAINTMIPQLLPSDMQAVLKNELDPTTKRSGSPSSKKPSRHDIADFVVQIEHADLPPGFRNALVARLRSGKHFSNFDRDKSLHKHLEKSRRHMRIKYLYRCHYDLCIGLKVCAGEQICNIEALGLDFEQPFIAAWRLGQ